MRGGVVVAAVVVLSCEGIAVAPRVSEAIRVSEVPLEYQRILLSHGWLCCTALVGGGLGGVTYWWTLGYSPLDDSHPSSSMSHASCTLGAACGVGCMRS